jgi:hypothetical protein
LSIFSTRSIFRQGYARVPGQKVHVSLPLAMEGLFVDYLQSFARDGLDSTAPIPSGRVFEATAAQTDKWSDEPGLDVLSSAIEASLPFPAFERSLRCTGEHL